MKAILDDDLCTGGSILDFSPRTYEAMPRDTIGGPAEGSSRERLAGSIAGRATLLEETQGY